MSYARAYAAAFAAIISVSLLLSSGVSAAADTAITPAIKPDPNGAPKRALFVGNSYLYYGDSMHNHVRRLAGAADPNLKIPTTTWKSVTISGSALFDHNIRAYLEPGKLRVKEPFEYVVLQGGSGAISSAKRRAAFEATVIEFDQEIRKSGAKTALYMTHAYVAPHKHARADMIRDLEELYVSTGNKVGALVIPVGLAFEEAYRRRPDIRLHKAYDGSHPELIGTYLAACVVYASLYGKSPVGNPYDYYGAIDRDTATFLQQVAQDTVARFYGRN